MQPIQEGEVATSGPIATSHDVPGGDSFDDDDVRDRGNEQEEERDPQQQEGGEDEREDDEPLRKSSSTERAAPGTSQRRRSAEGKGGHVMWLRRWFLASAFRNDDEDDDDDDDDDHCPGSPRRPKRKSWGSSLLRRCLNDLKGRVAGGDHGLDDTTVKKGLATGVAVTALLLVLEHHRRKRRTVGRRAIQSSSPDSSSSSPSFLSAVEAPLSLLYRSTNAGQVHTALLGPNSAEGGGGGSSEVYYRLKADGASTWKKSTLPAAVAKEFIHSLSLHCDNVSALPDAVVAASRSSSLAWAPLLTTAIPFAYLFFLYKIVREGLLSSVGGGGGGGDRSSSEAEALKMMTPQTTRITFEDVAGMPHQVVTDLREVVAYLSDPRRYTAVGARPPRAVLLHGPPGSGKTLLAQAVAGEASVPFFACSASEFVEVYVGRGASRVRALFAQARRAAVQQRRNSRQQQHNDPQGDSPATPQQYLQSILQSVLPWLASQWSAPDPQSAAPSASPRDVSTPQADRPAASILFIDELDALGKSRMSSGSNDEREQTLNQLLTELDGFGTREREFRDEGEGGDREGDDEAGTVIVIGATNRVDVLDPAILRRFERQIYVGYPATPKDRKDVLLVHARRVRCGADVDWDRIAADARTLGCSGADLANLVNEAALLAVREGSPVIEQDQLDHAARRIQNMKWREDHPGELLLGLRSAGIR